jgi:hypothetical protein
MNDRDRYAVINVHGYLVLSGDMIVESGSGFFGGDRSAILNLKQHMEIVDYSNEPFTTVLASTPETTVVTLEANSGGTFDFDGDFDGINFFHGYDLDKQLVLVPPKQAIGLHMMVTLETATGSDSGHVLANFSNGPHMVSCPAFLIAIVS